MNNRLSLRIDEAFNILGEGVIGGGTVKGSEIVLGMQVTVTRGAQRHVGQVTQLRRFKERPDRVPAGLECGVYVSGWNFAPGDVITDVQ